MSMDRSDAERARHRLADAKARLSDARSALRADLSAAAAHTDEMLSPTGLSAERTRRADAARARHRPQLERLESQVSADLAAVRRYVQAKRPALPDDPAALMRAQIAWDGARMRMEAGMPLRTIIAAADETTVLAIREWAPAWIEARDYRPPSLAAGPYEPPDITGLMRTVDDRLAEVCMPHICEAIRWAREADVVEAGFAPQMSHALATVNGTVRDSQAGMTAAIESQIAEQIAAHGMADSPAETGDTQQLAPAGAGA